MSKIMGRLQSAFVVMNIVLILATIIALPVGLNNSPLATPATTDVNSTLVRVHHNSGSYIFTDTENLSKLTSLS